MRARARHDGLMRRLPTKKPSEDGFFVGKTPDNTPRGGKPAVPWPAFSKTRARGPSQ